MIAHFQQDYTFYFDEEDIARLFSGKEISGQLLCMDEPVTILLKYSEEIYNLKQRVPGKNVFSNEADLAVIHWEGINHTLYFLRPWFESAIEKAKVIDSSVMIRWGAEKIHILAGNGSEAKEFKFIWGPYNASSNI